VPGKSAPSRLSAGRNEGLDAAEKTKEDIVGIPGFAVGTLRRRRFAAIEEVLALGDPGLDTAGRRHEVPRVDHDVLGVLASRARVAEPRHRIEQPTLDVPVRRSAGCPWTSGHNTGFHLLAEKRER